MNIFFLVIAFLSLVGVGVYIVFILPLKLQIMKSRERQEELKDKILEEKLKQLK